MQRYVLAVLVGLHRQVSTSIVVSLPLTDFPMLMGGDDIAMSALPPTYADCCLYPLASGFGKAALCSTAWHNAEGFMAKGRTV